MKAMVLYYSKTGHTQKMAEIIAQGMERVQGVQAKACSIDDLDEAWAAESKCIVLGSPIYFASVCADVKSWLEGPCKKCQLAGKLGGAFATMDYLHGGGDLATLPMENVVADADIPGIDDEFFVIVPDVEHTGFFLPYLFVVLKEGYTLQDIEGPVRACLRDYMQPVEIRQLKARPFFHFKTNRIGLTQQILAEQVKQTDEVEALQK